MSIAKVGTPEKMLLTIQSSESFQKEFEKISKANNLVRCPTCEQLVSKTSSEGKTIQHRKQKAIIHGSMIIKCCQCETVFRID